MTLNKSEELKRESFEGLQRLIDLAKDKSRSHLKDILVPVAAFILLRWTEYKESEDESVAAFENRPFKRLLLENLYWSQWSKLPPSQIKEFLLNQLWPFITELSGNGLATYLRNMANIVDPSRLDNDILSSIMHLVGSSSFETFEDRNYLSANYMIINMIAHRENRYFGSSSELVGLMVDLVDAKPGERIYDPCFGTGELLANAARNITEAAHSLPLQLWINIQRSTLYGVEIRKDFFLIGLVKIILAGIDNPNLECGDTLERNMPLNLSSEGFDCILAIPPFGTIISGSEKVSHFPIKTKTIENLFLQHIIGSLKPGGRAAVVVPEGVLYRLGPDKKTREKLLSQFCVEAVFELPKSFCRAYHNDIKTNIILFRSSEPADSIWFQRIQEDSDSKYKHKITTFKPDKEVEIFRTRQKSIHAWESSREEISARASELIVKRPGVFELETFLRNLQENEPDIQTTLLMRVAEIFSGFHYEGEQLSDGEQSMSLASNIPLVRISDIKSGEVGFPSKFLSGKDFNRIQNKHRLQVGDLLITASGTIGRVGFVREGIAGSIPTKNLIVVRLKKDINYLLPQYLLRLLQSGPYQDWLQGHALGMTIQHLSTRALRSLKIPIPSIQIQTQIASDLILKADAGKVLQAFIAGKNVDEIASFLLSDQSIRNIIANLEQSEEEEVTRSLDKLVTILRPWRNRVAHGGVSSKGLNLWLLQIFKVSEVLSEAFEWPRGAEQLAMLESLRLPIMEIKNSFPEVEPSVFRRVQAITDAIERIFIIERKRLLEDVRIAPQLEPAIIDVGKFSEIIIKLKNESPLPLRNFNVKTVQEQSEAHFKSFPTGEYRSWPVKISPRPPGTYSLSVPWDGTRFDGVGIAGEIQLAFEVRSLRLTSKSDELGYSPYIVGLPVDRKEMFFGRRSLIDQIRRQLRTEHRANIILLEGNRRSGKSSILKYIENYVELPGWIPVFCSFQEAEGDKRSIGLSTREVFRYIAHRLAIAIHKSGFTVVLPGIGIIDSKSFDIDVVEKINKYFTNDNPFTYFDIFLESILQKVTPLRILLMLDEFDKLQEGIKNGLTSPQVPENIRYLFHKYTGLSSIIAGSRRLKRLREYYWSALFGLGYRIGLDPLESLEARELVSVPVSGRLVYVPEAIELIINLCAKQPYLIQSLCNRIFDYCADRKERTVSIHTVNVAVDEMIKDNEHMRDLWTYAETERRRFILYLVDRLSQNSDRLNIDLLLAKLEEDGILIDKRENLVDDIDFLQELELLELDNSGPVPSYKLGIPLIGLWIRKHIDWEDVRKRVIRAEEEKIL